MKIKMTRTARGADGDGSKVSTYYEGQTYSVGDSLGKAFVEEMSVAVEVKPCVAIWENPPENGGGTVKVPMDVEVGPSETAVAAGPEETKPARRPRRALGDD